MEKEKFISLLKILRERQGISQKEISDWFGMSSPQFVSNIERGMCIYPAKWINTLSKKLDVPKEILVEDIIAYKRKAVMKEVRF